MLTISENNGTEEISLVTPTPAHHLALFSYWSDYQTNPKEMSSSKGVSSYSNPNMLSYGSFLELKDPSSETCMYTKACKLVEYGKNCDISSSNDKDEQTIWHQTSTKHTFIKLPFMLNDNILFSPEIHMVTHWIFFHCCVFKYTLKRCLWVFQLFSQEGRVNDIIEYDYDSYSTIPVIYSSTTSV